MPDLQELDVAKLLLFYAHEASSDAVDRGFDTFKRVWKELRFSHVMQVGG